MCFRYNDEPTTVRFARDVRTMAADLARIRWRGWTGEYSNAPVGAAPVSVPANAVAPSSSTLPLSHGERPVSLS